MKQTRRFFIAAALAVGYAPKAFARAPRRYYVSPSAAGNGTGLKASSAFTLSQLSNARFIGGDTILFDSDHGSFFGGIHLTSRNWGSGPVTFRSYGSGAAVINSGSDYGFYAVNLPGIAISNLNFTGGICIENNQDGDTQLSGPSIDGCTASGVLVLGSNGNSGFDTVSISNCTSHDNDGDGIAVYSGAGYLSGTPCFGAVTITGCTAYNNGGSGIVCGECDNVAYDSSTAYSNGWGSTGKVGIFIYDTNNYTVRYCESHHNSKGPGQFDGDGFNCDTNKGGSGLIEYCFSHDNDGFGFLFDVYMGINNATMRYCTSYNNNNGNVVNGAELGLSNYGGTSYGINLTCYGNTFYSYNNAVMLVDNTSWDDFTGTISNNDFFIGGGGFITYGYGAVPGSPANLVLDSNNLSAPS